MQLDGRLDDRSLQSVFDDEAIRSLKAEIRDAKYLGKEEKAAELQKELLTLLGKGGKVRPLKSMTEQARKNVGKAIKKARDHIKDHQNDLHQHLLRSVQNPSGRLVSYRPPEGATTWLVT